MKKDKAEVKKMLAKVSMKNPLTITAVMNGSDNKTTSLQKILKSDTEVIILPCNRGLTHWILVVIYIDPDPTTKFRIAIYDSLRGTHPDVVERTKRWLVREYCKYCKAEKSNNQIDGRKVQQSDIDVKYPVVRKQVNGSDCGVHVCMMIQCVLYAFLRGHVKLDHEKLTEVETDPIDYHIEMGTETGSSSQGIELFRQYMAYLIVEAGRLPVNLTASDDSDDEAGVNPDRVAASSGAAAGEGSRKGAPSGAAAGEGREALKYLVKLFGSEAAKAGSKEPASTLSGKDLRHLIASERLAQMDAENTGISYLDTTSLRILCELSPERKKALIKLSDVVRNMYDLEKSTTISDSDEELRVNTQPSPKPPKRKRGD